MSTVTCSVDVPRGHAVIVAEGTRHELMPRAGRDPEGRAPVSGGKNRILIVEEDSHTQTPQKGRQRKRQRGRGHAENQNSRKGSFRLVGYGSETLSYGSKDVESVGD